MAPTVLVPRVIHRACPTQTWKGKQRPSRSVLSAIFALDWDEQADAGNEELGTPAFYHIYLTVTQPSVVYRARHRGSSQLGYAGDWKYSWKYGSAGIVIDRERSL